MTLQSHIGLFLGKLSLMTTRTLQTGGGSALPGLITHYVSPNVLTELRTKVQNDIICVSGTNGKTSTANRIAEVLRQSGKHVLHNKNGSNLERGLISAFIQYENKHIDHAIFECDEAALVNILSKVKPNILLLTNLFRDQLDRYGEIESTRRKWEKMLENVNWQLTLIYNAADPQLHALATSLQNKYISVKPVLIAHVKRQKPEHLLLNALTNVHCPRCNTVLIFKDEILIGQGTFECSNCNFSNEHITGLIEEKITYKGINTLLARETLQTIGETTFDKELPLEVFGRGEQLAVGTQQWNIVLIKNPNGAYVAIKESAIETQELIVFALNDNFADGKDVSWIWDIPLEEVLAHQKIYLTTGTRKEDMALRLKYLDISAHQITDWDEITEQQHSNITIFCTYTALLDLQKWLATKGYKKEYWRS